MAPSRALPYLLFLAFLIGMAMGVWFLVAAGWEKF